MKYFGVYWSVWQLWVGYLLSEASAASSFQQPPRTAPASSPRSVIDLTASQSLLSCRSTFSMKNSRLSQTRGGGDSSSNLPENADSDDNKMNPLVSLVGGTTSFVVSATFYGVLAWKRDGLMVAFFLGSIANAIMSKVLKKLIAQTRPEELDLSTKVRLKPSDGGSMCF